MHGNDRTEGEETYFLRDIFLFTNDIYSKRRGGRKEREATEIKMKSRDEIFNLRSKFWIFFLHVSTLCRDMKNEIK